MSSRVVQQQPRPRTAVQRDVIVRIDGVTKQFPMRRRWIETLKRPFSHEYSEALRNVVLAVGRGEFFGLLGPNGAGKSTLFRILCTLILPDRGTASVAGLDVVRDPAAVRRILTPVVSDERSLNWRISARENLRLFGALYGLRAHGLRTRVDELLDIVELADTGEKMVGRFSTGMKQRLLLARALLSQPRVLLLDEPTRSLDPVSARRFRTFLRERIVEQQGCTVLLATHSAEEAFELCDRVAILDRGQVLGQGTVDELCSQVGDFRYRIWLRSPPPRVFEGLIARGLADRPQFREADEIGWTVVDINVPDGDDAAAEINTYLVLEGAAPARLERVRLPLADIILRYQGLRA